MLTRFGEDSIKLNTYENPLWGQTINESSLLCCQNHRRKYLFEECKVGQVHFQGTQSLFHLD